jgi:hypothetical protein
MYHGRHLVEALAVLLQPSSGLYGIQSAALPLEVALEYVSAVSSSLSGTNALMETLKSLKGNLAGRLTRLINPSTLYQNCQSTGRG